VIYMTDKDVFEQDDETLSSNPKQPFLTNNRMTKVRIKIIAALFSVALMIVIPFIKAKHLAFNAFYNTTLEDWLFIWDFDAETVPFFLKLPIIYLFVGLGLVYAVVFFTGMLKAQKSPESIDQKSFKKMYGRFDLLVFILHLMALYMVVNAFFFSIATIDGDSMNPTLIDGDNVVMMHMEDDYERYDLIVVKPDVDIEEFYIKRLIGLPGDTVRIELGNVYVNDVLLEEPYLEEDIDTQCPNRQGATLDVCIFTQSEDDYFLLGDNRKPNRSTDSRLLGSFTKKDIYGTVEYRVSPLQSIGKVE